MDNAETDREPDQAPAEALQRAVQVVQADPRRYLREAWIQVPGLRSVASIEAGRAEEGCMSSAPVITLESLKKAAALLREQQVSGPYYLQASPRIAREAVALGLAVRTGKKIRIGSMEAELLEVVCG